MPPNYDGDIDAVPEWGRFSGAQAMAAHNSGGIVIVQVERLVASGTLPCRSVHIPGAIVDKVEI